MTSPILFPSPQKQDPLALRDLGEAAYRAGIARATDHILEQKARFVFMAGPSCSGKSTTSRALQDALTEAGKRVFAFSTDDFFFDEDLAPKNEDGSPNYDAFEHTDSHYIRAVLERLWRNEDVILPLFDFLSGKRTTKTVPLKTKDYDVFVLEGIHALNDHILSALPPEAESVRLYLDVTRPVAPKQWPEAQLSAQEVRLCRRIIRDFKHRGADGEMTFTLWQHVIRMEKIILHPFIPNAHQILSSDLGYEVAVERDEVLAVLDGIRDESPFYKEALLLREKLMQFPSLPSHIVPEDSVLREFID